MRKDRWSSLKENQNKGVSLAVVLCVSAFFIAFSAAILYTAGLLTSQSTRRLEQERSYLLASSYGELLDTELEKYTDKNDGNAEGTFYAFVNRFLDSDLYKAYDSQLPESTSYDYVPEGTNTAKPSENTSLPEGYGNISIRLRKGENSADHAGENGNLIEVTGGSANYTSIIEGIQNMYVREYMVLVDVTAYYGDMAYTYTTEYTREEQYEVEFRQGDTLIVWDKNENVWKKGSTGGELYDPTVTGEPIRYTFDKSRTRSSRFVKNTYTEGGTADG